MEDNDTVEVKIDHTLIDKISHILQDENITMAEGIMTLLTLAAMAAQDHGLSRDKFNFLVGEAFVAAGHNPNEKDLN
jgi:hypothetical protein